MIRTKRSIRTICAAAAICLAAACRTAADEPVYPDVQMAVRTFSPVASESDEIAAHLIFWDEEHLGQASQDNGMPYYECDLPGKFGDYTASNPFKTGQYYPLLNTRVYALGYSPADLGAVRPDNRGAYYLPFRNGEDTTVLASNSIVGSSVYPFRDALEFRPATTRFIFRAIRTKNMYENLYVRDITVTMPHDAVPNILRWSEEDVCYRAAYDRALDLPGGAGGLAENPIKYTGAQLNTTEYSLLGVRYLALPSDTRELKGLTVRAQLSVDQGFPVGDESITWYRQWPDRANREEELAVRLRDTSGQPVLRVEPGESYLVTLIFDQEAFTIFAEKTDWEWGGKIPIPVLPPDTEGTSERGETETSEKQP